MKFSCTKNDFKKALKPIDKFCANFKKEVFDLKIYAEDRVYLKVEKQGYVVEVVLPNVEIGETGAIAISYQAVEQILKAERRNVLFSYRLVHGPEGAKLMLITPEGNIHEAHGTAIPPRTTVEDVQSIMNLEMDEYWQSLIQINRITPKKHLKEVFTKVKWVVTETAVRWVSLNQDELGIKHFQSFVSEGQQLFYVTRDDMDLMKKILSAITEQRISVSSTLNDLHVLGEAFTLILPIERNKDVYVEKMVIRDVHKYAIDIEAWYSQVEAIVLASKESELNAKQIYFRPERTEEGQLILQLKEKGDYGTFTADEFLKRFKNDLEGEWQCWLQKEEKLPMIAFVKTTSKTTFYLYVMVDGLI